MEREVGRNRDRDSEVSKEEAFLLLLFSEFPISIQGFDGPEMKFVRDSIMRFYAVRARAVTDPRWLIEGLLAGGKLFVSEILFYTVEERSLMDGVIGS